MTEQEKGKDASSPSHSENLSRLAAETDKRAASGTLSYGESPSETAEESAQAESKDKDERKHGGKHEGKHGDKKPRLFNFAVDFAYTLNHAIVCTLTDPITDVPITATVASLARKSGQDVEKTSFQDVLRQLHPKEIARTLKEDTFSLQKDEGKRFNRITSFFLSEVAGDFGAVPVVVGLQHFAPGFMKAIGKAASPIAKPIFKRSAERSIRAEFELGGMDTNTPEFDARVKEIYERELDKLPQAIMWTGVSPAINILMQKTVLGNKEDSVGALLLGKAIGSVTTSSLTVGLRTVAPDKAQKWDDWSSEKAGKPVARFIAKITGVDKEELEAGMKAKREQEHGKSWGEKISQSPSSDVQR